MIVHVRMFVCPFLKRVSGSSYTVENASNAALIPSSPEMEPPWRLLAVVLLQFSHNHPA